MKNSFYLWSILTLSSIALSFAYVAEHIWGLEPCSLCLYERIPYAIAIGFSLIALLTPRFRAYLSIIYILLFLTNGLLGGYHVGIEWKIFEPPLSCSTPKNFKGLSIMQMEQAIMQRPVIACDQVHWRLMTRSASEWNLLLCLGLLIMSVGMLWTKRR